MANDGRSRVEQAQGDPVPTVVSLREVWDEDLPVFFEFHRDPQADHMAAFTPRDPEDRGAFDAHWDKIRADDSILLRTIELAGQPAGYVGSFMRDGKREVCYFLGKCYWGKGIATAALGQLLALDPVRPIHAGVARDNVGSLRVLEKCGFKVVAMQRSFARARHGEIDELILKREE